MAAGTTSAGSILASGWIIAIHAPTAGAYAVSVRVASPIPATSVRFEVDGAAVGDAVAIPIPVTGRPGRRFCCRLSS